MSSGIATSVEARNTNDDRFHQMTSKIIAPIPTIMKEDLKMKQTNTALNQVNMRQMSPLLDALDYVEERIFALIGTSNDIETADHFLDESVRTIRGMVKYHNDAIKRLANGEVNLADKESVLEHAIDLAMLDIITCPDVPWATRRECYEDVTRPRSGQEYVPQLMHLLTKLHAVCNRHGITIPGEKERNMFQKFWDTLVKSFN